MCIGVCIILFSSNIDDLSLSQRISSRFSSNSEASTSEDIFPRYYMHSDSNLQHTLVCYPILQLLSFSCIFFVSLIIVYVRVICFFFKINLNHIYFNIFQIKHILYIFCDVLQICFINQTHETFIRLKF